MPWVALAEAMQRESATLQAAVRGYRVLGIDGAGWIETTLVTHPRAQHQTVEANQAGEQRAHNFF